MADTPRPRQPPGLYLLFGVEMWERFSYYGMRAFLVLFLVSSAGGLGWTKQEAANLYGWYTGLVYLTPLIGGYLADRVLGTHRAIIIGSIVIAAGHFSLALHSLPTFYLGLALIILGTGFFKSNISTMVGQLYQPGDRRRDADEVPGADRGGEGRREGPELAHVARPLLLAPQGDPDRREEVTLGKAEAERQKDVSSEEEDDERPAPEEAADGPQELLDRRHLVLLSPRPSRAASRAR